MPMAAATRRASYRSSRVQQLPKVWSAALIVELHGQTDDVVTLPGEQGRGDRGIDAARHGYDDAHPTPIVPEVLRPPCCTILEMPALSPLEWLLAVAGALGVGVTKAGFSGVSLVHVLIFAFIFGARESTGIILPMLVAADVFAVRAFRQHAQWIYVRRLLPPAFVGIVHGFVLMGRMEARLFEPAIRWNHSRNHGPPIGRMFCSHWLAHVPHSTAFAWTMGLAAGTTTMMANAAGPVFVLYALAVSLPKLALVGTGAWFFFIVNLIKLPFSAALGVIHAQTLLLNLVLLPAVFAGIGVGRWLTRRVPQRLFDGLMLAFAGIAALRLIGVW